MFIDLIKVIVKIYSKYIFGIIPHYILIFYHKTSLEILPRNINFFQFHNIQFISVVLKLNNNT